MIRRPPRSTRTDSLFPYTTLFRSLVLERVVAWLLQRVSGLLDRPGAALLIPPSTLGWLAHLPTLIVAVVIWRVFFRGSGYRPEERRVGQECVSTCRSRWAPYPEKKKHKLNTTI